MSVSEQVNKRGGKSPNTFFPFNILDANERKRYFTFSRNEIEFEDVKEPKRLQKNLLVQSGIIARKHIHQRVETHWRAAEILSS